MIEFLAAFAFVQAPVVVKVDRDNVEIAESCRIEIGRNPIVDADGNGVIQIVKDGVTVDFADQRLHGAKANQLPNEFTGIGIAIRAKNITLHNAKVSGYKVGIHALNADGLTIHHCDVSNNFHQRLKSTPKAEDGADWLWPHANDDNEWMTNYGAGLCVEDSSNVTIHDIRARKGQNGIILDRVNDSKVYDCDCSFLSGWGLAMWRSSNNVISRNAFDFCVRGYSHGVYNRGQDSAGILMFEQCCENTIAENSVTHGGDGVFSFAGKEALGEINPREDVEWYEQRGNFGNSFLNNDLSYAAAHGLEHTFSSTAMIYGNRFVENAICGIWGGYSMFLHIYANEFIRNGEMAYGRERGGVNIEHGRHNDISNNNRFLHNAVGVRLWWDADEALASTPWAKANSVESDMNAIMRNQFEGNAIAIELEHSTHTEIGGNTFNNNGERIHKDDASTILEYEPKPLRGESPPKVEVFGTRSSVGAHAALTGREHIIMTEWGPYDWESPLMLRIDRDSHQHTYRVLGRNIDIDERAVTTDGEADAAIVDGQIVISPHQMHTVTPYAITLNVGGQPLMTRDVLVPAKWTVVCFPTDFDPRTKPEAWGWDPKTTQPFTASSLSFQFQHGGPSDLNLDEELTKSNLPKDHFGTEAATTLQFPVGTWRIKTLSDDGIRVKLDGKIVIEDWTHHAPREHTYEFTLEQPKEIDIEVEHFELDGYAVLTLEIEAAQ